jgi:hypothetical protein
VYDVARRQGDLAGIRALIYRVKHCRPGYCCSVENAEVTLLFADGTRTHDNDVAGWLRQCARETSSAARPDLR